MKERKTVLRESGNCTMFTKSVHICMWNCICNWLLKNEIKAGNTHLIPELDAIIPLSRLEQFRSESGGDKLCVRFEIFDHVSDSSTILRVQCRVDLIKEVERRRVALLDGEDEGESHKGLLPTRELIHVAHVRWIAREWDSDANSSELLHIGNGQWRARVVLIVARSRPFLKRIYKYYLELNLTSYCFDNQKFIKMIQETLLLTNRPFFA